jgi:hypothetical protein
MNDWMRKILESKRKSRQRLAGLSFSEKVRLLEKLCDRSQAIASNPLRQQSAVRERSEKQYHP